MFMYMMDIYIYIYVYKNMLYVLFLMFLSVITYSLLSNGHGCSPIHVCVFG